MRALLAVVALFMLLAPTANAEGPAFNYQGRIASKGKTFTGTGQFKFVILTKDGGEDVALWSNDGTESLSEPSSAVPATVSEGLFNVIVGNDASRGMGGLKASIFNVPGKIYLRVWFSDGHNGFEILTPDREITMASLLGDRSDSALTVYVNATTGDDRWSGLFPSRPKKTIQAAVDCVPGLLLLPAVIEIADGFYPESVVVRDIRYGSKNASLELHGNAEDPSAVRICGADAAEESATALRADGLSLLNLSDRILVTGIQIDNFTNLGFLSERSNASLTNVTVKDCDFGGMMFQSASQVSLTSGTVSGCMRGIMTGGNALVEIRTSNVHDIGAFGISSYGGTELLMYDSAVWNCGQFGVHSNMSAIAYLQNCEIHDCGGGFAGDYVGARADANSVLRFKSCFVHDNIKGGVGVRSNSFVFFYGGPTTISNHSTTGTSGVSAFSRGVIHNQDGVNLVFSGNTTNVGTGGGGNYLTSEF